MNSETEKEIFTSFGWEYDYVKREWTAPDGYTIGVEDLVKAADEFGPNVEMAIIDVAKQHGKS